MKYYISNGELQKYLKKHYETNGYTAALPEIIFYLKNQNLLKTSAGIQPLPDLCDDMTDDNYLQFVDNFPLEFINPTDKIEKCVSEDFIFLPYKDVHSINHLHYLNNGGLHTHDFFEMNYVFRSTCSFFFEKEHHALQAGELCIIAPASPHDITVEDDTSVIITIMIRKSTFNTAFSTLLSQSNLLSQFFRSIFYHESQSNHLIFFTENTESIRKIIKNLSLEIHKTDSYSNSCCISWIHLLLALVLRHYSHTLQFYNYRVDTDFSLILQYIQHNYQALTLGKLASFFHYTVPYLSNLIKQNTGSNYTDLIKQLRMADAKNYLANTDLRITEIAERIGYHSADHFAKIFRSEYGVSPQIYRKGI